MLQLKNILANRKTKIAIEIMVIMLVFATVKAFMQRHLVSGFAPQFAGTLLDGKVTTLQAYQGKPVLLHFWATWCPVCRFEQKNIDALSRNHQVITVVMNSGADAEVKAYLRENELNFPVMVDRRGHLAAMFGVIGVPTSFVVSPDGKIVFSEVGYTTQFGLWLRMWLSGFLFG
jgi:peroxiredoxin